MNNQSKYETLIDAETWAFIECTQSFYPPNLGELSVQEQRALYNGMCAAFQAPRPKGVLSKDNVFSHSGRDVRIRHYEIKGAEPTAQIIYYHGGGFVVGGLESHDDVCAELCASTGTPVMAVDYALAPEQTYPSDFEDALAAFEHAAEHSNLPIILMGDSAGSTLAAAVSHAARKLHRGPMGQILIYPSLDDATTSPSYQDHAFAPMLTLEDMEFYRGMRMGKRPELCREVTCSPLADTDFSDLPPTVVFTAECDPLASDGKIYADRVQQAGGRAHCLEERGLVHGYLRARHSVGRAQESFTRIVKAAECLAREEWPYSS